MGDAAAAIKDADSESRHREVLQVVPRQLMKFFTDAFTNCAVIGFSIYKYFGNWSDLGVFFGWGGDPLYAEYELIS